MGEVEHEFGTLNSSIVFIIIVNAASVLLLANYIASQLS